MSIGRMVFREIACRWFAFAIALVGVAAATATVAAQLFRLREHDRQTEAIVARQVAETRQRMAKLEDDYRKITKGLGFNVLILPKDQNLSDLFANDFASKDMPEEFVDRLSRSKVVTVQHLLPSLQQKINWPEHQRTVILMGVRGETPILGADTKQPILQPVPAGTMVVGHELGSQLRLKAGDKVRLMGRPFAVSRVRDQRGTKDDITVWISLAEAQEMLEKRGRINAIHALECVCAADSLDKVRAEIGTILPETQVIEYASQTLARAEARQRAAAEAKASVEQVVGTQAELRQRKEQVAAIVVPLSLIGAGLWVALLALGNARDRRPEIGVLLALGLRTRQILAMFLARSAVIGVVGAAAGFAAALAISRVPPAGDVWRWMILALVAGPVLSIVASWVPALWAARQDPAGVLSEA